MTELAYMTRDDWAQDGTAMREQSAVIRDWLGSSPYVFSTTDLRRYQDRNSADREVVGFFEPRVADSVVVDLSDLGDLLGSGRTLTVPLLALHPRSPSHCDLLRTLVTGRSVVRLFVLVWWPSDMVRVWLDGVGAMNLHTHSVCRVPDALQLEAAGCWVDEQYNGLSSGNGKAAVVQLLRAFTASGYSLDSDEWLRSFFAAGGGFAEAAKIAKLIAKMRSGTRYRVNPRYRPDIFDVLRERAHDRLNTSDPSAG